MSNFYIDHDATQAQCEIVAYHRMCAPDELVAQGDQPCCLSEADDADAVCAGCGERFFARLTLREAQTIARMLRMSIRKRDGEYRVNFTGASAATAYYTDDLRDALDTARAMRCGKGLRDA